MKNLREKTSRPRKKVIAFLLSLLMVLSIALPSGGSGVRYNSYAEGEESANFDGVDLATSGDASKDVSTDGENGDDYFVSKDDLSGGISEDDVAENDGEAPGNSGMEEDADEELAGNEDLLFESSNDLKEYVDRATAETGIDYDADTNTWTGINLENDYTFTIYFKENQLKQFVSDDSDMTYAIPAGISADNISGQKIDIVYNNGTITVHDNPFTVENGVVHFNFNTSDPNWESLKNASNAEFYLTFKGKFDGTKNVIDFGNGFTRNIATTSESNIKVDKSSSGTISADSDYMTYTVNISSTGYNENIAFSDIIAESDSFEIYDVTYTVKDRSGADVSDVNVTAGTSTTGSLNYTIDKLYSGQKATFTYKVKAKGGNKSNIINADTDNDGKVTINNTASITCPTQTDTSDDEYETSKEILITSISSKEGSFANDDEKANGIVTWTIKLNNERLIALNGKHLTDELSDNHSFYSDITIKKYNTLNAQNPVASETVSKPEGKTIDIEFSDTTPYYYEIVYKTKADNFDQLIDDALLSNKATYEGYGSRTAEKEVDIPEADKFTVDKEATRVSPEKISWKITINVPKSGFDSFTIKDVAPDMWGDSGHYMDDIVKSSINVNGLNSGEGYTVSYETESRSHDSKEITKSFSLQFHKSDNNPGLDSSSSNRNLVITYDTDVDSAWFELASNSTNDYYRTHINNVTATANGINKDSSAYAKPIVPEVIKQSGNNVEYVTIDGKDYPVYEFQIKVTPVVEDTITITDTLPEGFMVYTDPAGFDYSKHSKVVDTSNWWGTEIGTVTGVSEPDTDNNITFTIDVNKDSNDEYYNAYWLDYYIIPKDKNALIALDQSALDEDNDKVTLTNKATYSGITASCNFDYAPKKENGYTLTKEMVGVVDGIASYSIDINPEKLELNGGDNITLTDEFENLSIDYSSISIIAVSPLNAPVISCDVRGNVLTAILKDSTHYIITYKSKILKNGVYSNEAKLQGFKSSHFASYSAQGGGSFGDLAINIFKQEKGNALNRLEGVTFKLYKDENGTAVPVKNGDGQDVTATTDSKGIATFKGVLDNDGWNLEGNQKYYIEEINPPEGYLGIGGMYEFTISNESNWDRYVFLSGETMRVDNSKIDLKVTKTLKGAPDDLDLSTIKFTVTVSEGEGENKTEKTYEKTLQELKDEYEAGSRYVSYDSTSKTYTMYFVDLTTGSTATVKETIVSNDENEKPKTISYKVLNDAVVETSNDNYTSGSAINVSDLGEDSIKTVAFENSYSNAISVTGIAYKKIDNRVLGTGDNATYPLDGLSFGFKLYDIPDSLYPSGSHENKIDDLTNVSWNSTALSTGTATDTTGGKVEFDKITYNVEVTDTFPQYYYYKIVEDDSAYSGIEKDTDYVVMSVVLNKDANDEIIPDISYTKYNADGTVDVDETADAKKTAFNNVSAPTTLSLSANKYLTENDKDVTPENIFNFKLEPVALGGLIDDQINATQTVTNSANNISFTELGYDGTDISNDSSAPTVYRYKISEDEVPAGYSKDTNYYCVDVTVTRDETTGGTKAVISKITKYNSLNAIIENNVSSSKIDFTNSKSARTGSVQLSAYKTIDGSTTGVNGTNYNKLSFYSIYVGEQSSSLKPDNITPTTSLAGIPEQGTFSSTTNTITFPIINYSTSNGINTKNGTGRHIYKIYEGTSGFNGITNSSDYYIVVVSVTDSGSGASLDVGIDKIYKYEYDNASGSFKAPVQVSGTGTENIIFDNMTKQTKISLQAEKKIAGGTHDKDGFEFKIQSVDTGMTGGKVYDALSGGYTETVTTDASGIGKFSDLVFKVDDVGIYTFDVTEIPGTDSSITYDPSVFTVTVEVKINNITKAVESEITSVTKKENPSAASVNVADKRVEFTNTLIPDKVSVDLSVKKELLKAGESTPTSTITDSEGNLKEFSFELYGVDESGSVQHLIQNKQNKKNGNVDFDAIVYDNSDLANSPYFYMIKEVAPTTADGYEYSTKEYFVKVVLSEDTVNNRIVATTTYYADSIDNSNIIDEDDMVFLNKEKEAVLKLKATKNLVGASLSTYSGSTNGFEFVAERNEKSYKGYNDASGNVVIDINEVFSIADVIKTNDALPGGGPYEYVISETSKSGFECDTASYTAKVTFGYDANKDIVPTVKYYKSSDLNTEISESEVVFKNIKTGNAELTLTAKKEFLDYPLGTKVFNFELYDESNALLQTKQNDTSGNVIFDKLTFTQDDIPEGSNVVTKTFKIKEYKPAVQTQLPGYIYDEKEYTVTVTLTRDENSGISITHSINDGTNDVADDEVVFTNRFDTPDQLIWPLSIKKTLEGNSSMVAEMFEFEVYEANAAFEITNNTPKYTAKNDQYGNVKFGDDMTGIPANSESYFVVREKIPTETGMLIYDGKEYYIIITTNDTTVTKVESVNSDNTKTEIISGDMTFKNTIKISVKKTDSNGTPLSGAVLQVKRNGYTVKTSNGNDTTDGIVNNKYTGITVGQEYVLTEISEPLGYSKAEDIKFKVVYNTTDKKYELQINKGNGYVVADAADPLTVTMQDEEKSLIINKKISGTSTSLAGATLQIKDGSSVIESAWTTDTAGGTNQNHKISLSSLDAGKWYTLEETAAPFGYKKAEPVMFKIDNDNKVWSKKSGEADSDAIELTETNGEYTLVMYDEPLELTIEKYKKGTTDKLTGAVFQIYQNDHAKTLVQSGIRVNSNGTVDLNVNTLGLLADTEYVLEETDAPDGYELADPIIFVIGSDNRLIVNGGAASDEMILKVYDKPEGTIYICKVDPAKPNVNLSGALVVISQDGTEKHRFTTTDSAYEIRTSTLAKNKVYILKEEEAPKNASGIPTHYIAHEIKFYIDNNGVLYVQKSGESVYTAQTGNYSDKVVMEDRARDYLKISKVDITNGNELSNAVLRITKEDGSAVYEKTVDTDGNIITTSNKLEHTTTGTKWSLDYATFDLDTPYVLTEITAPDGYEVAESITFKLVEEDGKTSVKILNPDGSWIDKDNMTVVMQDAPMNYISFIKLDASNGESLTGAGLTIYDSVGNEVYSFTSTSQAKKFRVDEFIADEEYTLRETSVPDGFYKADDITFKVSYVSTAEGRVRKLFIKDTDGTFKVSDTCSATMKDERIYQVKVSKVDITTEEEIPGAHIQILDDAGRIITEWDSTDAPKYIEGLMPNITYTLRETVAPKGYKISTDTTFTLKTDGTIDYDKTTTAISTSGVLLVKDAITELNFTKYGLSYESCSSAPSTLEPLEGVVFEAYEIDDNNVVSNTPAASAVSSENGTVLFEKLAKGKYQIREVKTVGTYKLTQDAFYAVVDDNDFEGLTDENGNKIEGNRIVNDRYRTDIRFTKVSERNQAKKLAGSKYGLYRKDSENNETLITTKISDKNGLVVFEGVLLDTTYVIRELESPEGYYISEKPIELTFKLDGTDVVLATFNDGNKTAVLAANGEITWLEPSVVVNFLKVDENNNPLPGATLAILDMNGVPVKDENGKELKWVSTTEPYEIADVFEDGVSYQLVELEAPEGYSLADPVKFEIPGDTVGSGENKLISVTMTDKRTSSIVPPKENTPPSVKTGDEAPIKPVSMMMLFSLLGIIYMIILGRRRQSFLRK